VVRSEITVADLFVSCAYGSPLSDLRCDAIGRGIFSRALFRGLPMEPSRIRLLLCVVDLQSLCTGRYRHALAAPAHCATDRGREEIYSRLHHHAIRVELGLSFDDESAFVAGLLTPRFPSASIVPSAVEGSR